MKTVDYVYQLTLELHLVLDDESLASVVDRAGELGRDGVVGSGILDDETGVALHALVNGRLLNGPLANVGPLLLVVGALGVLRGVRRLPSRVPALAELLEEVGLDGGRLMGENVRLAIDTLEGIGVMVRCPQLRKDKLLQASTIRDCVCYENGHTVKVGSWTDTAEAPSTFSSAWALPASSAAVMALATVLAFIVVMLVQQQTGLTKGRCEL